MLTTQEYRAIVYRDRMSLDSSGWIESEHPRDKRGKFQKRDAITSPEVAADAMRRAILTRQDVRHAVYRADIGYVDFIWGNEGGSPSATGKRKGAVNNRQLKQTAFDATHSASRYVGASWTVSAQRFDLCRIFTAAFTSRSSTRPQSGQLCTVPQYLRKPSHF